VQGTSSSTSSVTVQDAFQSIACNVDVRGVYETLFTFVMCFFNAGTPNCPASSQSGTGMNKKADAGTSPIPE
jgi:hypothetical protein